MDPAMPPSVQPVRAVRATAAGIANSAVDRSLGVAQEIAHDLTAAGIANSAVERSGVDNLLRTDVFIRAGTDSLLESRAADFR